jgi:thioredoxin reductase
MPVQSSNAEFDVAIVGGGPAGLSAAIVLGRACRRVVLFDHQMYRNYAAQAVHGYLGLDGRTPADFREEGRAEAKRYDVCIKDLEVTAAAPCPTGECDTTFEVVAGDETFITRALLLATGIKDCLPQIPGLTQLYGRSVHHCPYCDGWEYRGKRLIALGSGVSAAKLALTLRGWSSEVIACTNGSPISKADHRRLEQNRVRCREEKLSELRRINEASHEIVFETGPPLSFDAIFFGADQTQSSSLLVKLGCRTDDAGLAITDDKQCTHVDGLFVAGDVHSDVQMAIVAAAEGAIAATAISKMLLAQDATAAYRRNRLTNN